MTLLLQSINWISKYFSKSQIHDIVYKHNDRTKKCLILETKERDKSFDWRFFYYFLKEFFFLMTEKKHYLLIYSRFFRTV